MKKINDTYILDHFKNGDTSVFKDIVIAYQDSIYNLCVYMIGDPTNAEDVTQEVFLKAYQKLKSFTPNATIYTWLYRIAVNTCIDYKRKTSFESIFKHQYSEDIIENEIATPSESKEETTDSEQLGFALKRAINKLSEKLKAVVILYEMDGLSYEEIAEALDISIGTVKSRLSRARKELKRYMKKYYSPSNNF
jgi:RNA polymerase sigma-70 factor (ECF subfamily)